MKQKMSYVLFVWLFCGSTAFAAYRHFDYAAGEKPNQAVDKHDSIDSSPDVSGLFSFKKHTGLYAYRREFLLEFTRWPQSDSEQKESLEQMRALDRGRSQPLGR